MIMYLSIIESCIGLKLLSLSSFCVMYPQYHAARGIMFVPPIEFGKHTLYSTRTPSYFVNLNRTRLSQKQGRYQGTLIWNNLPSELKEPMSYMNFYNSIYTYFINDFCMQSFFVLLCMYVSYCVCVCVYCVCICPSNEEERLCRSLWG